MPAIDSSVRPARSRNLAFSAANSLGTLSDTLPDQAARCSRPANRGEKLSCDLLLLRDPARRGFALLRAQAEPIDAFLARDEMLELAQAVALDLRELLGARTDHRIAGMRSRVAVEALCAVLGGKRQLQRFAHIVRVH